MSWFYELFGAEEKCSEDQRTAEAYRETKALFDLVAGEEQSDVLIAPNGRHFRPGRFESPSLAELRERVAQLKILQADGDVCLQVDNVIGNVRELHVQPKAAGALFQAASQFNCLEFMDATVTPEYGVTRYLFDKTQGPACALACAASTVWRNYFMPVGPSDSTSEFQGQTADVQLNCLRDVQALLGDDLLEVRNGYSSSQDVEALSAKVESMSAEELDVLRASLRIGVQWDAEVTDPRYEHKKNPETKKWEKVCTACSPVTQVFCSALALRFNEAQLWKPVAQLVLDAAYEATLAVAACNVHRGGSKDVYLTLLGGANFHNDDKWIEGAIRRALDIYKAAPLHVHIVHYSAASPAYSAFVGVSLEWQATWTHSDKADGKGPLPTNGKGKGPYGVAPPPDAVKGPPPPTDKGKGKGPPPPQSDAS